MNEIFDLLIIGGGASGLTSAVTAFSMGVEKIAILERLPRTGKKLLATGNGRCNLSHKNISALDYQGSYDVTEILHQFGDVETFFELFGLYCRTDEQGRIYPYSMSANAVLDALRLQCSGISEFCNEQAVTLRKHSGLWHITTESGNQYSAKYVIFSAGGTVQPKFGTDGTAFRLLEKLNLPIVQGRPILCPLLSDKKILHPLKGLRVKGSVSLYHKDKIIKSETGEIQFTEQALSGICIFNLSSLLDKELSEYQIFVNLFPELDVSEILSRLYCCQAVRCDASGEDMLSGLMQKPLARSILKQIGIKADFPCSQLSDLHLNQIAEICHDFRFPVLGTVQEQAQASAGGVHGNALDEHLQVKSHSGLYITGEAVDVHAPCGGYQLHWAWASGYTAGTHIAERILS
ncbi:MAG: aminoacetone oxidase family FAD-binding enzyme [Oscillospiraceae bacterium]|nr:aminoacetone oxidase family FAD-binding enzyme [Oscillospiraceae bacterium]